jgi:hypothetical protein
MVENIEMFFHKVIQVLGKERLGTPAKAQMRG